MQPSDFANRIICCGVSTCQEDKEYADKMPFRQQSVICLHIDTLFRCTTI
ncbi:hypothetical protein PMAG_a1705 [Pseudoalteromonas mariniglutinosa NCIMB 1770]|nr:hypothetical protein [Pseudoalteromonas mariniglutinosa NCIMB 1770]